MKNRTLKYIVAFIAISIFLFCKEQAKTETRIISPEVVSTGHIKNIEASSTLKNGNYSAKNLMDQKPSSWCEGNEKEGIGEKISIEFKQHVKINSLWIDNGFHDPKHWKANNRVKSIQILFYLKSNLLGKKEFILEDKNENLINADLHGDKIEIVITDVYRGNRDNDTCLNEIRFSQPSSTSSKSNNINSCIMQMNWTGLSAKGKEKPDWFDEFCMEINENECNANMGFNYSGNQTCIERGYNSKCLFQNNEYLIKNAGSCP